jgi:hypothetical protein
MAAPDVNSQCPEQMAGTDVTAQALLRDQVRALTTSVARLDTIVARLAADMVELRNAAVSSGTFKAGRPVQIEVPTATKDFHIAPVADLGAVAVESASGADADGTGVLLRRYLRHHRR